MSISLDTFTSNYTFGTSATFSYTNAGNALGFLGSSWDGAGADAIFSTITFHGDALSQARHIQSSANAFITADVWYLFAPFIGTANVVVTMAAGTTNILSSVISLFNVNTLGQSGTFFGGFGTPPSLDLTVGENGCWRIDVSTNDNTLGGAPHYTGAGAGQNQISNNTNDYFHTYKGSINISTDTSSFTLDQSGDANMASLIFTPAADATKKRSQFLLMFPV